MQKITVGLIRGRHEMPVSEYIFDSIESVLDFAGIEKNIRDFCEKYVGVHTTYGCGINQNDYADIEIFKGNSALVVYVTGLTAVTAALIKVCAENGISLTLMHYDAKTGDYVPQVIFY